MRFKVDEHLPVETASVLRLKTQDKPTVLRYIKRIATALQERSPDGELWIVQHDRIRYRGGWKSDE